MSIKKEIYMAKSLSELNKIFKDEMATFKKPDDISSLERTILEEVAQSMKSGDEEKSYILLLKLKTVVDSVKTSTQSRHDPTRNLHDQTANICAQLINCLSDSLKSRYDEQETPKLFGQIVQPMDPRIEIAMTKKERKIYSKRKPVISWRSMAAEAKNKLLMRTSNMPTVPSNAEPLITDSTPTPKRHRISLIPSTPDPKKLRMTETNETKTPQAVEPESKPVVSLELIEPKNLKEPTSMTKSKDRKNSFTTAEHKPKKLSTSEPSKLKGRLDEPKSMKKPKDSQTSHSAAEPTSRKNFEAKPSTPETSRKKDRSNESRSVTKLKDLKTPRVAIDPKLRRSLEFTEPKMLREPLKASTSRIKQKDRETSQTADKPKAKKLLTPETSKKNERLDESRSMTKPRESKTPGSAAEPTSNKKPVDNTLKPFIKPKPSVIIKKFKQPEKLQNETALRKPKRQTDKAEE